MEKEVQDIILYEIRELRREVSSLKTKFGLVAVFFGALGAIIKDAVGKKL